MQVKFALCVGAVCLWAGSMAWAQDAVKVDPKHYTVVSEDAQVRVLRAKYGPHEKSVMHSHPNAVAVYLTDINGRFTFPDGKTQDVHGKAGDVVLTPAGAHLPENTSDSAFEVIVVELKGHAAPKAAAMKAEAK